MSDKGAKSQRYALAVFQALIEKWQTALADVSAALSKDQDRYSRLMDGSRTVEELKEALPRAYISVSQPSFSASRCSSSATVAEWPRQPLPEHRTGSANKQERPKADKRSAAWAGRNFSVP